MFNVSLVFNDASMNVSGVNDGRGYIGVLNDSDRLAVNSEEGAIVNLDLRFENQNSRISYDPTGVDKFNRLRLGEAATDVFWYAVKDSHNAIGVGKVTITITGVNDTPIILSDPSVIDSFVSSSQNVTDIPKHLVESVAVNYSFLKDDGNVVSLKYSGSASSEIIYNVHATVRMLPP